MKTKKCNKCKKIKPLLNFFNNNSTNKNYKDGYNSWCKQCAKKYAEKWYQKNKEKVLKHSKNYYKKNKEHFKKYRKENKKHIKELNRKYREENKEKLRKINKDYYENNKESWKKYFNSEKNKERCKIYYQTHKKERNEYNRQQRKINVNFKLAHSLRNRIGLALKQNWKAGPTIELLGCSIEHLKNHLESQFKPGMNWSNWSITGWHIDHIKPCASFDLSNENEQYKCFNYTNLQPLWAKENRTKWDKSKGDI
jgi:hypothetical protein